MQRFFQWLTALCFFFVLTLQAQSQATTTAIKTQALEMARAISKKDAAAVQKFIYPALLESAKEQVNMTAMMDTISKKMEQFKPEIKRITIGNPGKIVTHKKVLQALVPQEMEIKTTLFTVVLNTTLVALSDDKGKHWYFADGLFYQSKDAKIIKGLPPLSPELVLPPQQQPQLIPAAAPKAN
ncbi:MAG: hypothetical protein SFU21_12315 [Flavihumibacter sp.]|nr:hypothetical protein [Flavihumibacter sp.]